MQIVYHTYIHMSNIPIYSLAARASLQWISFSTYCCQAHNDTFKYNEFHKLVSAWNLSDFTKSRLFKWLHAGKMGQTEPLPL